MMNILQSKKRCSGKKGQKGEMMKLKLHDALGSMEYDDLVDLHKDLKQGAINTRKLVEDRIVQKEKEMGKQCVVCQADIDPSVPSNYTLLFGPEGLRRKASFCAIDCLKYFIADMERRKEEFKRRSMEPAKGSVQESSDKLKDDLADEI
jgi:hypothetical protein